jgi:arylsulfatase A-like enzyme
VHGFDEFYGNLYHLNAEEDPENQFYPRDLASGIDSDDAVPQREEHELGGRIPRTLPDPLARAYPPLYSRLRDSSQDRREHQRPR